MQPVHVISLVGFAFCLSIGQILLKRGVVSAQRHAGADLTSLFTALLATNFFIGCGLILAGLLFILRR